MAGHRARPWSRALIVASALLVVAIVLQLIPLPFGWIDRMSPSTAAALTQLDVRVAVGTAAHPLSLNPPMTQHALLLAASFLLLMFGSAALFSATGTVWFLTSITLVSVGLALAGILNDVGQGGRVYGWWQPLMTQAHPFGPFINRNHFGGWALMALPLSLGLFAILLSRGWSSTRPGFRNRLLWMGSAQGSRLVMVGGATLVIALGLILTMSRSAMGALMVSVAAAGFFAARRLPSRPARLAGLGLLSVFFFLAATSAGVATITSRFEETNAEDYDVRHGAWVDALSVIERFPVTGTGLNTYGTAMLLYQRHNLGNHYAQAHSDYLQLAAEGGLLLVLPALLVFTVFLDAVRRRFRDPEQSLSSWWARAAAVTGLVGIGLQELVEFSLQMPANAALFAALCGIALHDRRTRARGSATG